MDRNERRKIKYNMLRDAGFTPKECTKYKNHSWDTVHKMVSMGKEWVKQRDAFFKSLGCGKS